MMRHPRWLLLPLVATGCISIDPNAISITYDFAPQQFGRDFGNTAGNVPDVSCATNPSACAAVPAQGGAAASCDPGTKKCVVTAELRLVQSINLSQQANFPQEVANSKIIQQVTVDQIRFWTPTNTLSFATPPIDLYVGSQAAQKETDPGVTKLGTIPVIPKGERTAQQSPRQVQLTDAGKSALGLFAKDFRTPFNLIIAGKVTVPGGQPAPGGKVDLFVQPVVAFKIPLK